jgi:sulfonate transport system ATP-binding protein
VTTQLSPAVVVRGVSKSFDGRSVLRDLDLVVSAGEFVALLGASGSGKTTLLRLLLGLESPDGGEVLVPEARTTVFQEPRLVASKKVWPNEVVGLARHADAWPGTLSGGEAQRVALARALIRQPNLLLLDEPFAALDALTRLTMQALVAELIGRYRPGVLLVTHDVEEAVLLADRILVLKDGRISADVAIDLPRPRVVGGEVFDDYRSRFLAELGVVDARRRQPLPPVGDDRPIASSNGAGAPTR